MPGDDRLLIDGDRGWGGFASRINPLLLEPGQAALLQNVRLDRGAAACRKGVQRLADGISTSGEPLTLPFVLTEPGPTIRDTYTGGVFAGATFQVPAYGNEAEYVAIVGPDSVFLWKYGESAIDEIAFPAGESVLPGDDLTVLQAAGRLYVLRYRDYAWLAVDSLVETSGTAVCTTADDHGLEAGMRVRFEGSDKAAFNQEFEIDEVTDTDEFEFAVSHSPGTSGGTVLVKRVLAPLYWDGAAAAFAKATGGSNPAGATYWRQPSGAVAAYFNSQLVVASGRDTVLISDVLDPDTYDPAWKSFRVNAGSDDRIVAVHPWSDVELLVFCRKSVWLARIVIAADGVSVDPTNSSLRLLTNEIGCAAPKSIVTAGSAVYWLAENGVQRLTPQLDMKLSANTRPLSDPVQDIVDAIDWANAGMARAAWWDNRYWLAYPADGENKRCLIFNALNNAWESSDTYHANIDDFLVADYGGRRRLMAVSRSGKLYLLDERTDGDMQVAGDGIDPIAMAVTTRRFDFGRADPKRFRRAMAAADLPPGAGVSLSLAVFDPDATADYPAQSNAGAAENGFQLRYPIRAAGHSAQLTVAASAGRPTLRSAAIEAAVPENWQQSLTKS